MDVSIFIFFAYMIHNAGYLGRHKAHYSHTRKILLCCSANTDTRTTEAKRQPQFVRQFHESETPYSNYSQLPYSGRAGGQYQSLEMDRSELRRSDGIVCLRCAPQSYYAGW